MPRKPHKGKQRDPERVRQFVLEYLRDFNGARAAVAVGYSKRSAKEIAYELLHDPAVREQLTAAQQRAIEKLEVTLEDVVSELRRVGFSRIDEVLDIEPDHVSLRGEIDEDAMRAISSIEQTKDVIGGGDDKEPIVRTKLRIRLHEKIPALLALGKHLGLRDRKEIEHKITEGKVSFYLPDNGRRPTAEKLPEG